MLSVLLFAGAVAVVSAQGACTTVQSEYVGYGLKAGAWCNDGTTPQNCQLVAGYDGSVKAASIEYIAGYGNGQVCTATPSAGKLAKVQVSCGNGCSNSNPVTGLTGVTVSPNAGSLSSTGCSTANSAYTYTYYAGQSVLASCANGLKVKQCTVPSNVKGNLQANPSITNGETTCQANAKGAGYLQVQATCCPLANGGQTTSLSGVTVNPNAGSLSSTGCTYVYGATTYTYYAGQYVTTTCANGYKVKQCQVSQNSLSNLKANPSIVNGDTACRAYSKGAGYLQLHAQCCPASTGVSSGYKQSAVSPYGSTCPSGTMPQSKSVISIVLLKQGQTPRSPYVGTVKCDNGQRMTKCETSEQLTGDVTVGYDSVCRIPIPTEESYSSTVTCCV